MVGSEFGVTLLDLTRKSIVIFEAFHRSFPYVFIHDNAAYMLPEQAEAERLTLYRVDNASMPWSEFAVTKEASFADSVLLLHDGYWYLFASDASRGNHDKNLQLFFVNRLTGPYKLHPSSPLRLSLSGSRMAGGIRSTRGRSFDTGRSVQACTENA
jgi:hypothetical protein